MASNSRFMEIHSMKKFMGPAGETNFILDTSRKENVNSSKNDAVMGLPSVVKTMKKPEFAMPRECALYFGSGAADDGRVKVSK